MKLLRAYQQDCVNAIWDNLNIHPLACVPTGGGKSLIIAELCKMAIQHYPGTRIAIIAPKMELVSQNYNELIELWPEAPAGIWCAGLRQKNEKHITIGTIQSMYRSEFEQYDLIIVDECHLIQKTGEGMFHSFFRSHKDAKIIGLTATPFRASSGYLHRGEGALFDKLVYNCDIVSLVNQGYLSNIRAFDGDRCADVSQVHIRGGEFKLDEMQAVFMDSDINNAALNDCIAKASDRKKILIFCAGVYHVELIAKQLPGSGAITGNTSTDERNKIVEQFRRGEIRHLINCDVFTTGFNVPDVDCIVLLRSTNSPGLYMQMVGRGLRIAKNKRDCLLLDYGGNVSRHGTIDAVTVMDGKETKKESKKTWNCPQCKMHNPYSVYTCGGCGFTREKTERNNALNNSAYNGNIIGTDFDEVTIQRWEAKNYTSSKGNSIIRIDYFDSRFNFIPVVSEYIAPGAFGFAGQKAYEWCIKHGITANNNEEFMRNFWEAIMPVQLLINHAGKYKNIQSKFFNKKKVNI